AVVGHHDDLVVDLTGGEDRREVDVDVLLDAVDLLAHRPGVVDDHDDVGGLDDLLRDVLVVEAGTARAVAADPGGEVAAHAVGGGRGARAAGVASAAVAAGADLVVVERLGVFRAGKTQNRQA